MRTLFWLALFLLVVPVVLAAYDDAAHFRYQQFNETSGMNRVDWTAHANGTAGQNGLFHLQGVKGASLRVNGTNNSHYFQYGAGANQLWHLGLHSQAWDGFVNTTINNADADDCIFCVFVSSSEYLGVGVQSGNLTIEGYGTACTGGASVNVRVNVTGLLNGSFKHLAFNWNQNTGKVETYYEGSFVTNVSMSLANCETNSVYSGTVAPQFALGAFDGMIDEAGIHNRTLTPEEISTRANRGPEAFPPFLDPNVVNNCTYPNAVEWNISVSENCELTSAVNLENGTLNIRGQNGYVKVANNITVGNFTFMPQTFGQNSRVWSTSGGIFYG